MCRDALDRVHPGASIRTTGGVDAVKRVPTSNIIDHASGSPKPLARFECIRSTALGPSDH